MVHGGWRETFSKEETLPLSERAKIFSFLILSFLREWAREWEIGAREKEEGENPFGAAAAAAEEEDDEEVVEGLGTKRKGEEERETGQKWGP